MTDKKFGEEGKSTKKKGIEANLGQKDCTPGSNTTDSYERYRP